MSESKYEEKTEPANAMTVDVEDYFQVSAFEKYISRENWKNQEYRIESNIDQILSLFDQYGVSCTFFMLGWVAEKSPVMVQRISDEGHEIASHGYEHVRVTKQKEEEFREDVTKTKQILEDISGQEIKGYRAASYSIGEGNLWALDVLQETSHSYSSSIYPIRHDLYGMPRAPRFPFYNGVGGILEIPVTTLQIAGHRLPCGGGGYFRLLPYWVYRKMLKRVNREEQQSGVFYFHPWEIDPSQPRQSNLDIKTRFRHYINLGVMKKRLENLLTDFEWRRMDQIFLNKSYSVIDLRQEPNNV